MHWNSVRKLVSSWGLVFKSPSVPVRIYYLALAKSVVCCCLRKWVCYTTSTLTLTLALLSPHLSALPWLPQGLAWAVIVTMWLNRSLRWCLWQISCWRSAICWGQWQRKSSGTFATWRTSLWCVCNQYPDLEVEPEKDIRPFHLQTAPLLKVWFIPQHFVWVFLSSLRILPLKTQAT